MFFLKYQADRASAAAAAGRDIGLARTLRVVSSKTTATKHISEGTRPWHPLRNQFAATRLKRRINRVSKSTLLRRVCTAAIVLGLIGTAGAESAEVKSLAERDKLTGDWGGARSALEARGIEFGLEYTGEILGISGGLYGGERPGRGPFATYEGILLGNLDVDLEKFMGWTGGKFRVKGLQINNAENRNAADYVGSLADPSNIDAYATTRLFTLWFEQNFGTLASIRVGQMAIDEELLTNRGLINNTFGWATILSSNLPSGGPAYPLGTPGVRLKINPTENISLRGAVFSGDPAGKDCYTYDPDANPQTCNRYGTTFSFSGGAFWIGEAVYKFNQEEDSPGLAGSYRFGSWYEAAHARRQYDAVDPANRLVAGELERRWNEALQAVAKVEGEIAALIARRPPPLGGPERQQLMALGADLERAWSHPAATAATRKRILRAALTEIVVRRDGAIIHAVLHWQGGDHTELQVKQRLNAAGRHNPRIPDDTIALVRELARLMPDRQIARLLNRTGVETGHGNAWTQGRVRGFRNHHDIAVFRDGEWAERGEITLEAAAKLIGVCNMTALRMLRRGEIKGRQACAGAPWVIKAEDLAGFASGKRRKSPLTPDATQQVFDFQ